MASKCDNEIIGWGLAGSILAWQFYFRNLNFCVYDSLTNDSTRVAAGLVNPVVFKRLTRSWNADSLVPYAEHFYSKIEAELNVKLISRKSIFRVFASVEEANNWSSKQGDERFQDYLKSASDSEFPPKGVVDSPFGIGKVETFGNLDTNLFLDTSKAFFQENGIRFMNNVFRYTGLDSEKNYFFCEGFGLVKNPWFKDLPLKPTHGETLIIETDELNFEHTLNKNMFVMHLEGNKYKVGATYNWELTDPITTTEARIDLEARLAAFTNFNYKVIDHLAGIRPTVKDRRPLIGVHPEQKNAIIFNGLGAKGVMIGPFYAAHLLNHLFEAEELDLEVDIQRFNKKLPE